MDYLVKNSSATHDFIIQNLVVPARGSRLLDVRPSLTAEQQTYLTVTEVAGESDGAADPLVYTTDAQIALAANSGNGIIVADLPTGTDDFARLQEAINDAAAEGNKTVHVRNVGLNGPYITTDCLVVPQGVMIACEGSQGSNTAYGTSFLHKANGSFIKFDATGTNYAGTGGGLTNALIVKENGYSGGNAIEIIAQSDLKRPGEMFFLNVLAYGSGTGRWERGLVIDGTACNTEGARGVRHVHMHKCRFASVTTAGETIVLNQVTHFISQGLAADSGSGASAGLLIKGINDGVFLNALDLGGGLTILANDASNATTNLHVDGKISGAFVNNDALLEGTLRASFSTSGNYVLVNKSPHLRCSTNINPEFKWVLNATVSDATGDGTNYQVAFDTEEYDRGNSITAVSNTFTCAAAGRYHFSAAAMLAQVASAHTRADFSISQTGSATRSIAKVINPYALSAGGFCSADIMGDFDLAYGDQIKFQVLVSNGTKVVDIYGSASTRYTWLSGYLVSN